MTTVSIAQLFDLTEKTAVITGGAQGIGQAIAFRLAEAGAKVMIADVDQEKADQTVEEIRNGGKIAQAVDANMGKTEDISKIIQTTLQAFGGVDILVNNAGIAPLPFLAAIETHEKTWDLVMDVNLKGMFLLSQAAAREMIKQGRGGKVINIASTAAFKPPPDMIHYSASKAGVVSLTQSLGLELAPYNILVNAIAPGGVVTPMAKATFKARGVDPGLARQKGSPLTTKIPLGRWAEPDDVAKVALFLASRASDYMTGLTLLVDGGSLLM